MPSDTTIPPQLFGGGLRPSPGIPGEWSSEKQQLAREVLADVRAFSPELLGEVEPDADIEDHFEDACRISAAWRASDGHLEHKECGTASDPWTTGEWSRRFGPIASSEEGGRHAGDRQAAHPLVIKHGGRAMRVCSLGFDDSTDASVWLAARHRDAGVQRGIVKNLARKGGVWSVELDADPAVIRRRLMAAMDWGYIYLEGARESVTAQDELELTYEYRLFVIDGRVISGAGCVEEFTPLDRDVDTAPFDTRVRRIRGHLEQGEPSAVEDLPELVARLRAFGEQVAAEHGGTIVIDVALDAVSDQPVVIEFNGISNSGLYASDPWLVAKMLRHANDRGYHQ